MQEKPEITIRIGADDFSPGDEAEKLGARIESGAMPGFPGAVASFTGLVRDHDGDTEAGRKITAISLEHYPAMTESELARIAGEAAAKWPLQRITIIHRIGRLPAGARIVFVGCASRHREAAFRAAAFIMDFLKTDAPFWKSEETDDGHTAWVDADAKDTDAVKRWRE